MKNGELQKTLQLQLESSQLEQKKMADDTTNDNYNHKNYKETNTSNVVFTARLRDLENEMQQLQVANEINQTLIHNLTNKNTIIKTNLRNNCTIN